MEERALKHRISAGKRSILKEWKPEVREIKGATRGSGRGGQLIIGNLQTDGSSSGDEQSDVRQTREGCKLRDSVGRRKEVWGDGESEMRK